MRKLIETLCKSGVCPVCGNPSLEWTGLEHDCNGGLHLWKCPVCECTGGEGFSNDTLPEDGEFKFDGLHYDVRDKDGNQIIISARPEESPEKIISCECETGVCPICGGELYYSGTDRLAGYHYWECSKCDATGKEDADDEGEYFDVQNGVNEPVTIIRLKPEQKDQQITAAELEKLIPLCEACDSELCIFNPEGICRFPLVTGRKPNVSDETGCTDCVSKDMQA